MKIKPINFTVFLLLTLFAQIVLSQEKTIKFQFGILDESGNAVSDLKLSDIQILQDKKTLLLKSIESKAEGFLEVMIMIDSSASQEKMLPLEKKFAERVVDEILIKGRDKIAVIKFSGEISLMQDLTDNFPQAKKQLNLIEFEPPTGSSAAESSPAKRLRIQSRRLKVQHQFGILSQILRKRSQK